MKPQAYSFPTEGTVNPMQWFWDSGNVRDCDRHSIMSRVADLLPHSITAWSQKPVPADEFRCVVERALGSKPKAKQISLKSKPKASNRTVKEKKRPQPRERIVGHRHCCAYCGYEFRTENRHRAKVSFCSPECKNAYKIAQKAQAANTYTCVVCDQQFTRNAKPKGRPCCSAKCARSLGRPSQLRRLNEKAD